VALGKRTVTKEEALSLLKEPQRPRSKKGVPSGRFARCAPFDTTSTEGSQNRGFIGKKSLILFKVSWTFLHKEKGSFGEREKENLLPIFSLRRERRPALRGNERRDLEKKLSSAGSQRVTSLSKDDDDSAEGEEGKKVSQLSGKLISSGYFTDSSCDCNRSGLLLWGGIRRRAISFKGGALLFWRQRYRNRGPPPILSSSLSGKERELHILGGWTPF